MDELTPGEDIFSPDEPTKIKPDTKPFLAKKERHSPLHWREQIKKKLSKLLLEGDIEKVLAGSMYTYRATGCPRTLRRSS